MNPEISEAVDILHGRMLDIAIHAFRQPQSERERLIGEAVASFRAALTSQPSAPGEVVAWTNAQRAALTDYRRESESALGAVEQTEVDTRLFRRLRLGAIAALPQRHYLRACIQKAFRNNTGYALSNLSAECIAEDVLVFISKGDFQ